MSVILKNIGGSIKGGVRIFVENLKGLWTEDGLELMTEDNQVIEPEQ